jgi:hypothetical protein
MSQSPFKFLNPYEKIDKDYFFERTDKVDELRNFVKRNRVVLLYGASGTGKTSIIRCGLANKLNVTDWMPVFIRRHEDINRSLLKIFMDEASQLADHELPPMDFDLLARHLYVNTTEEIQTTFIKMIASYLKELSAYWLRPVYLIFDQFEELFILGSIAERQLFIRLLKSILAPESGLNIHIIIVMREEYFADMDEFEKDIPGILDRRLRIEHLGKEEIKNVILRSCEAFNIKLENPEENVQQIIDTLTDKNTILLPYLQVYLGLLWKADYDRTYPNGYKGDIHPAPLEFQSDEITEFGKITDIMYRFLLEVKQMFDNEIREKFPERKDIPEKLYATVLDCFVNEQGSKRPLPISFENGGYIIEPNAPSPLQKLPDDVRSFALKFLEDTQILRKNGNGLELAHDSLAHLIDKQRDVAQTRQNTAKLMIMTEKKTKEPIITYELIKSWEPYLEEMQLTKDERAHIEIRREKGRKQEVQQIYANQQSKRNKRLVRVSIFLTLFLALAFWTALKKADSYHAIEMVSSLDTIRDKLEALQLARYAYDYLGNDDKRRERVEEAVLTLMQSPSIAKRYSVFADTLKTSAMLQAGLDVDISGNGKYIVYNDSAQPARSGRYILHSVTGTWQKNFDTVSYAYFLNRSDTLLLAYPDGLSGYNSDPVMFKLFNCATGKTIRIFYLNKDSTSNRRLYGKQYLSANLYSERDSYKIVRFSSGRLAVPYYSIQASGEYQQKIMVINAQGPTIKNLGKSEFSISISHQENAILYGNPAECTVYYDSNADAYPIFKNPGYGDFIANGSLVFSRGTEVFVSSPSKTITKSVSVKTVPRAVYAGNNSDYLVVQDTSFRVALLNMKDTTKKLYFNELWAGCDFTAGKLITYAIYPDSYSDTVYLRDFSGVIKKRIAVPGGIESIKYNKASGNLLVKSGLLAGKNNLQILYLLDGNLDIQASYYLTPNDAYNFNTSGGRFYIVRDNMLMVFDNKASLYISTRETALQWLNGALSIKGEGSKVNIQEVRKRNRFEKFPSQTLGF